MVKKSDQSSKQNSSRSNNKYSSDTNLPFKNFSIFSHNEFDDNESYQTPLESDSEDDTKRLAKCLPSNMLDEPDHFSQFAKTKFEMNNKGTNAHDDDCGSVSSESDKEESYDQYNNQTKNMKNFNSHSNNSASTALSSSKKVHENVICNSPDQVDNTGNNVYDSFQQRLPMISTYDQMYIPQKVSKLTPEKPTYLDMAKQSESLQNEQRKLMFSSQYPQNPPYFPMPQMQPLPNQGYGMQYPPPPKQLGGGYYIQPPNPMSMSSNMMNFSQYGPAPPMNPMYQPQFMQIQPQPIDSDILKAMKSQKSSSNPSIIQGTVLRQNSYEHAKPTKQKQVSAPQIANTLENSKLEYETSANNSTVNIPPGFEINTSINSAKLKQSGPTSATLKQEQYLNSEARKSSESNDASSSKKNKKSKSK